jgi:putative ATPase
MEPLALRLRPTTFDDVIGQPHLTDLDAVFRKSIESNNFCSFVLYGPSGSGKTSIVNVLDQRFAIHKFNATTFTAKEVRKVLDGDGDIIVMIDECYRLTAPQSDILLPYLETSRVRFIGCTVENPFHSMRMSLLSRCHIYETEPLSQLDVLKVIVKGAARLKELCPIHLDKEAAKYISNVVSGDARKALSILEAAFNYDVNITLEVVKKVAPSKYFILGSQDHFDLASAFQGSIQASDPDAAIYWLAKWLESGEDPRYIARRLLVSASEDAAGTPICASVAHAAYIAAKEIGRPECDILLAHATILVATAPRNKSALCAISLAISDVRNGVSIEVPKAMKDSHYKSCKKLGRGAYNDGMNQEAYVGIQKKYYQPERWSSSRCKIQE